MRLSTILFVLLSIIWMSCKEQEKQKIDLLPDIPIEEVENIINNPQSANGTAQSDGPKLFIENPIFRFDSIAQGDKVSHKFKIKNVGNKKLVFLDMRSSCGCTIAKKPKDFLQANEESEIEVIFDSKGKYGDQSRKISIFTNCYPGENYIELKGYVSKGDRTMVETPPGTI